MRRTALVVLLALLLGVAIVIGVRRVQAQSRPRVSPHERTDALIDTAKVAIVYGRPSMRGRTIFGSLVPYDQVWCPGADEATTLDSSKDLVLNGLRVPSGPHTIWMRPTADRWTLIVSKDPSGFHTRYPARRDLGRVDLLKRELDAPVEQLTFEIRPTPIGGEVVMSWERTSVSVPFTVVK